MQGTGMNQRVKEELDRASGIRFGLKSFIELSVIVAGYGAVLALVEPFYGQEAYELSILPVIIIAWRMGLVCGLLGAVFLMGINAFVWHANGDANAVSFLQKDLVDAIVLLSVALVVGGLSELRTALTLRNQELVAEVTHRQEAEDSLLASEQQNIDVIQSMSDAVIIYVGERAVFANAAFLKLVDVPDVSHVIGTTVGSFMIPEDRELMEARTLARQRGEDIPRVNEARVQKKNEEICFVQFTSTAIVYQGQPGFMGVVRDVTEQRLAEEAKLQRVQELEALTKITSILVEPGSAKQRIHNAFEEFARVAESDRAVLQVLTQNKKNLDIIASVGVLKLQQLTSVPVRERGISAQIMSHGEVVVANDYQNHPDAMPILLNQGIKSSLSIPLKLNGEIRGIVSASSLNLGHFTEARVKLLTTLTNGIAALIDNTWLSEQLVQELSHRQRRFKAFQASVSGMTLKGESEDALRSIVDGARELSGATYSALAVWGDEGGIETWIVSGLSEEEQAGMGHSPSGHGLLGLLRHGGVVRTGDATAHSSHQGFPANHPALKAFLGVPIMLSGNHHGALFVANVANGDDFSDDDEQLLSLFAAIAGVHLENAALYDEVSWERGTLAAVQAGMTEGLLVVDDAGNICYFNQAAERLLGLKPETAKSVPIQDAMGLVAPDQETEETLDSLLSMLQKGVDAHIIVELVLLRPEQCQLSVALFPIPDVSGRKMSGMVVRDVTRERLMEQRRDTFVSVASHELRTPMTAVMGFAELLLDRDPGKAMRQEWLGHIHHDSQRLAAIVDDLLNVSRLQAGQLTVNWANVSLCDLIEDEVSKLRESNHTHRFIMDDACDLPEFAADEYKLAQVIGNLLDNAVKYSPEGGDIAITTRYEPENRRVVASISDQGVGIALEDQVDLFNSFRRINREETQHVGGTGLGLYVVKELVELMQGDVWLDSEVNKGSTFYFSIPLIPFNADQDGDLSEALNAG